MTIEIRELVIKATVVTDKNKGGDAQMLKMLEQYRQEILRDCREQLRLQLSEKFSGRSEFGQKPNER